MNWTLPGWIWPPVVETIDPNHTLAVGNQCGNCTNGEMTYAVKTIAFPPNGTYFWNDADAQRCPSALSVVSRAALRSNRAGWIHIVLTDGSVRFLSESIDLDTYKNLADRADGNVVGEF